MRWLAVLAASAAAAAPALPFARSGARVRSGYELARTVDAVGLAGAAGRTAVIALALLPLAAAGALVGASLRRPRAVATLAAMAGTITTLAGAVVLRSPLTAEPGAPLAVAIGVVAVVTAAVAAAAR